ncbi:MAG: DUF1178 family protein [Pseudomonadota bacterium]
MIKYALRCSANHEFEGWFRSSKDFDEQKAASALECPICGDGNVEKAIMAPAISPSRGKSTGRLEEIRSVMNEAATKARDYVEKNFEHVGSRFPEEARKIHYGEVDARPIYGEATPKEAKELKDEGVGFAPVPMPVPAPNAMPDQAGLPTPKSSNGNSRNSDTASTAKPSPKPKKQSIN